MSDLKIKVNRAPVLTLWAAVVAERLGFERQEALTLGKSLAGLNAQSKGQRLGIFSPGEEKVEQARERVENETFFVELLGRAIPVTRTRDGIRAVLKDQPVTPQSVETYLDKKFGENLGAVTQAMRELSESFPPAELARRAFALYESFRPEIPEGQKGWGAAGDLDLQSILSLKKS